MELINRIRKSRKGFTLVEIIVVLVILAILAAFTIPTMLGFVNDANAKAKLAEAREVYVAAQAAATEYGAKNTAPTSVDSLSSPAVLGTTADTNTASTQMKAYLDNDVAGATWTVTMTGSKVTSVVNYIRNGSKPVTITPGS